MLGLLVGFVVLVLVVVLGVIVLCACRGRFAVCYFLLFVCLTFLVVLSVLVGAFGSGCLWLLDSDLLLVGVATQFGRCRSFRTP